MHRPEVSEAETKAILSRHAWRFHGHCRGKGYVIQGGQAAACSCAMKRMRRALEAAGQL